MRYRIIILWTNIVNTFRRETAYFSQNWSNLFSTVFYTLALIVFIDVLFSNITTLAGYNREEMLFMVFIGQAAYYFGWGIFGINGERLNEDINNGSFDFVLVRPAPPLFFILFRNISIIGTLRDSSANILVILFLINWATLHITLASIILGLITFIAGQIIWQYIRVGLVFPAFWFGNAKSIMSISYELTETHELPLEGYSTSLRILFTTLIPTIIVSAMAGSVVLNKSNGLLMAGWAVAVAIAASFIFVKAWEFSLKHYSSASS